MTVKRAFVIFIVVLVTLLLAFILGNDVGAEEINDPIPPDQEVPWGDYQVKYVYANRSPVEAELCYPSNADCQYKILMYCLESDKPNPMFEEWYRREGSRIWQAINSNHQDLKWLETIWKPTEPTPTPVPTPTPEPREYRLYMPMAYGGYQPYECDCRDHTCDILINTSVWRTLYLLEYPKMGTVSGVLNLDASKHEVLNVRCYFKRGSVHDDLGYEKTILIIDCKGKDAYTVNCPNGICPSIGCDGLNGTADCVGTAATYTCDLICRGKFNLTDTP